jgi:hypothetical protein
MVLLRGRLLTIRLLAIRGSWLLLGVGGWLPMILLWLVARWWLLMLAIRCWCTLLVLLLGWLSTLCPWIQEWWGLTAAAATATNAATTSNHTWLGLLINN